MAANVSAVPAQTGQPAAIDIVQTRVAPPNTPVSAADPNQVVCKEITTIGTRFTRRVCKTVGQIALEREQAKDKTSGLQGVAIGPDERQLSKPSPSH